MLSEECELPSDDEPLFSDEDFSVDGLSAGLSGLAPTAGFRPSCTLVSVDAAGVLLSVTEPLDPSVVLVPPVVPVSPGVDFRLSRVTFTGPADSGLAGCALVSGLASIRGSTPLKFLRADFCRAPVRGQPGAAGLPSFSCGVRSGLAAGGQRAAAAGGLYPMVLHHNVSQCCAHGQWLGRCRIGRRWGRASRAGMVMMRRRRVVPRATA